MLGFLKSAAINLGVPLASAVITFGLIAVAGELYLRSKLVGKKSLSELAQMAAFDPLRGWRFVAGDYDYSDTRTLRKTSIHINALGLRGKDIALRAEADRPRITLVGDSFLFAAALEDSQSPAAQLGTALAQKGYGQAEILNASLPGYGTGQQIILIEELLEKGVDLGAHVVVCIYTNDVFDNLGLEYREGRRLKERPEYGVDENGRAIVTQRAVDPTLDPNYGKKPRFQSTFLAFLKSRLQIIAVNHPNLASLAERLSGNSRLARTPGVITAWYTPNWQDRWQLTQRLLLDLVERVSGPDGARPVSLVFLPSPIQATSGVQVMFKERRNKTPAEAAFLEDPLRPQNAFHVMCKTHALHCFDPFETFRAEGAGLYLPADGHFNETGAQALAAFLADTVFSADTF